MLPPDTPRYLSELNERQREAALHTEGALLILAGAGAGKTKTVTHRILHLIHTGASPGEILAVTFTNKAAREMRERVMRLLGETPPARATSGTPFVSTFHSLCVSIIRENSEMLSLPKHFTILDRGDSIKLIKRAMEESGIPDKQFEPKTILNAISKQKGDAVSLSEYREKARGEYYPQIVSEVWERYRALIAKEKALDFDDLLLSAYTLLKAHPDLALRYQTRWRYIHIDEYQDTNIVQNNLARILAGTAGNICVVGDIDQSIYGWRGASIDNILQFETYFPDARTILLEENYRSTQIIVEVSNRIIAKNIRRKEKVAFTKNDEGEAISVFSAYDEKDEANFIVHTIKKLAGEGVRKKEIVVLYRANFQSRAIEEALLRETISYSVLGVKFFERKEVKDILSYIRASLTPEASGDLSRALQTPSRGIGKVTLLKILSDKREELPPAMQKKVGEFFTLLARIKECAQNKKPSETVRFVLEESGYLAGLKKTSEEDVERAENLRELVTLATTFDTLPPEEGIMELLTHAALESDQDALKDTDAVTLMTVHAAKGLEFPYVFVTGLEEGLFPHERMGSGAHDDEEERRLFYVALTRAEKKVFLSYASTRTIFGSKQVQMPSQFLLDIDDEFLMQEERTDEYVKVIYLE